MMKRFFSGALLAAALLAGGAAQAHRFHAGMTDVTHNAATGNIEIVHTFMAHDMEALIAHLNQGPSDLTHPDDETALRAYMDKHFYLLDAEGKRLPVRWVGMSAAADTVVLFQEVEKTPIGAVKRIRHDVLAELLPDQRNTVNVSAAGKRRTLSFTQGAPEQDLAGARGAE